MLRVVIILVLFFLQSFLVKGQSFSPSLLKKQSHIGMRTRYHSVNDDWLGDAQALTTRITLSSVFQLDDEDAWRLSLAPNYVYAFNQSDYNSIAVTKNTSPIIDPENFSWSQAFFSYRHNNNWQVRLGRQVLAFDNERMVGTNEFWQTPQHFDAVKFDYNDDVNWHIQYAYSNKVKRIFGSQSKASILKEDVRYPLYISGELAQRPIEEWGEHKLNSHLLNVRYTTDSNLNVVAYNYWVENKDFSWFSTNTLGIRIFDEFKPKQFKYRYTVEYAQQQDIANNNADFNVWYHLLEASVQYNSHILQLSQEIFSQDNHWGFFTPLGSNHKFQGWTDSFSSYNRNAGMRDRYITYRGRKQKLRWKMVWHHFVDYATCETLGQELDIELQYRFNRQWQVKFAYSDYKADQQGASAQRVNQDISAYFFTVSYNI